MDKSPDINELSKPVLVYGNSPEPKLAFSLSRRDGKSRPKKDTHVEAGSEVTEDEGSIPSRSTIY